MDNAPALEVYKSIVSVTLALSKDGISKDRKNQGQGYNFRGIDDVYNALASLLAANQLCVLPRLVSRSVIEHQSKNGGMLFYVCVEMEFVFVSAVDGSQHVVKMAGEAMDSGDKATNKAMSAAYKYACLQTFCIPTEGDNDADASSHQVKGQQPKKDIKFASTSTARNMAEDMHPLEIYAEPVREKQPYEIDWKSLPVRYHLPVNKAGKDMEAVRDAIKKKGFKFNPDDKHWYGKGEIPKLNEYLRPLEKVNEETGEITADYQFTDEDLETEEPHI